MATRLIVTGILEAVAEMIMSLSIGWSGIEAMRDL
jgi:hypothetical protein